MTDTTPPHLVSVSPPNGSSSSELSMQFVLIFDEPIDPSSPPVMTLTFPEGNTLALSIYSYVIHNNVIVVYPSWSYAGTWTLTVQDGTVRDLAGNVDPEHISVSQTIVNGPDTQAPYLVAVLLSQTDTQSSVTPGSNIGLVFSEGTPSSGAIQLYRSDGTFVQSISLSNTPGTGAFISQGGAYLTIVGLNDMHTGTGYYLSVPAGFMIDGAGNPSAAFTYSFTTSGALDTTAPTLASTTPAGGALHASLTGDITLTFNETIKLGSGSVRIYRASDNSLVDTISISTATIGSDGETVTLKTGIALDPATAYYLLTDPGIVSDISDNAFAGVSNPTTIAFHTDQLPFFQPGSGQNVFSGSGQLAASSIINLTNGTQLSDQAALVLQTPQSDYVFLNHGSIVGTITTPVATTYGVFFDGPGPNTSKAFFINDGLISVSGSIAATMITDVTGTHPAGDAAVGIAPGGWFPYVENTANGVINVTGWNAWGIMLNGGGDPINDGRISVRGGHIATGVDSLQNVLQNFTNNGDISVSGVDGTLTTGVLFDFASFQHFVNTGSIEVNADSNAAQTVGISFNSMGNEIIDNSGSITASIAIKEHFVNTFTTLTINNTGTINGDVYFGAGGMNTFNGANGTFNGTIYEGPGPSTVHAGAGNSVFMSGPGTHYLDGGAGIDIADFSGKQASYNIVRNGDGTVTVSAAGETDTLVNVEYLVFQDSVISTLPSNARAPADFDGGGQSDILWQAGNGQPLIWLMNGSDLLFSGLPAPGPGFSWRAIGTGDFDGDHYADILWQNTNGQMGIWLNDAVPPANFNVGGNPGTDWKVIDAGDFDGDGKSDILWQNTNGQAAIWLMNGTSVGSQTYAGGNPGTDWKVIGAYDFNGDGKADILWQNRSGQAAIWTMNGATPLQEARVDVAPAPGWTLVGAGDFESDQNADLLWENGDGQAAIWLMSNGVPRTELRIGSSMGSGWRINSTADFNGDGKSDILWQNIAAQQTAIWLMDGSSILSQDTLASPGPNERIANNTPRVVSKNDFNGDSFADLTWQSSNGQPMVWLMNGGTVLSASQIDGNPGTDWRMAGSGDFNNDGKADILWQNISGQAALWYMSGTTPLSETRIFDNPGPDWRIVSSGDFNGDGKADILWQNTNGQAAVWLMNGTSPLVEARVGANPGTDWKIIGSGDFDGDGKSDILWQNANGQVAIWLMDGANPATQVRAGNNPGASWKIAGIGDFNGDGKSDILWQQTGGQPMIWLMDSANVLSQTPVGSNPGSSWTVQGAADINGDGRSDILLQNSSGLAAAWLMSGTTILSNLDLGTNPGSAWHLAIGTNG